MLKVYIAGPITKGNSFTNCYRAIQAWHELHRLGFCPFCPHLSALIELAGFELPHAAWIEHDLEWVKVCDAVLRLPGESTGADLEERFAKERGIPVCTSIEALVALRDDLVR